MSGESHVPFGCVIIGNNPPREKVTSLALAVSAKYPTVVSIGTNIAIAIASDKIVLPIVEVLLSAAIDNI